MNVSKAGRLFLAFAGSLAIAVPLGILAFFSIAQPWLALIPAAFLAVLYWNSRKRVALVASCCWLCYLPYEWGMKLRILCSGECNIRVDLLLIYPCLLLVSLAAILVFLSTRLISPS
ncbi:MAG: hypothetical protein FJW26_13515 [Acidimicrobiia bacterium]|nr:hypothetical protein [Acidimicrobiia bacterium]